MHELEFLQNINNKEILTEILHHSVDFLIGNNKDEKQTLKLCHKYGLNSPDEFMLAIRTIARKYRYCCVENYTDTELLAEFGNLSSELKQLIPSVLSARRPEIIRYLIRYHNAQKHSLIESFDWDVRFIMGDSSFAQNQRQIATCTFNCRHNNEKVDVLHFQMSKEKLDEFIGELEKAVDDKR